MKTLAKMLAVVAASVVVCTLLLVLVYFLPTEAIRRHVNDSIDILLRDGVRNSWAAFSYTRPPRDLSGKNTFSNVLRSAKPYAILDGFTDSLMLNKAIYKSNQPLMDAMMIPSLEFKQESEFMNPVEDLKKSLDENMKSESFVSNYSRYWNGYLVYMKPLLMIMGVPGIRIINLILQMIMFSMIVSKISRMKGSSYSLAFALGVLVIDPISTVVCFQYSHVYYIMLFTFLAMLFRNNNLKENGGYCVLFTFSGILTSFFDMLTYPSTVLGMSTVLYLILNDEMSAGRKITDMIKLGFSWCFGYASMWSSKWFLSYLITGYDTISDALTAAGSRTAGGIYALTLSWQWLFVHLWPVFAVFCVLAAAVIIAVYICVRNGRTSWDKIVPLLLVSLYPFVWYAFMKQHSFIHYFFTHKNLAVTVFALSCVAIKCSVYKCWKD